MTTTPNPTLPFKYPEQAILIHIDQLDKANRSRIDYGDLPDLWESISKVGLIHPPTVSKKPDGTYILIAGGRRTAAMQLGGMTIIPVISFDDLPLSDIVEMEGEENIRRLDMNWKERVMIIARGHELKVAEANEEHKTWGMRDTGALMGVSSASVSHAYQIRSFLLAGDREICDAPTLRVAYEVLLKRRENEAMRLTAGFTGAATKVVGSGFIGTIDVDSIFDDEPIESTPESEAMLAMDKFFDKDEPVQILETKTFALSQLFFIGDCLEVMPQFNPESVDHIVTDIPYGISMENMERIANIDTVVETHDVEQNLSMMLPFLENSYRLLKPNGYCVFWYDLDHHEKLHAWAKEVGFKAQRWPLVWQKLHPCLNNAPTKNFTKNAEYAMVLRKGNAVLNKPQSTCIIAGDGAPERKLYDNPFAKPAVIWKFIFEAIAYKGQIVLDPFCGQMSSTRAAIDLGLTPMGIEIDKDHFLKGLNAVKRKLMEIANGQAVFT